MNDDARHQSKAAESRRREEESRGQLVGEIGRRDDLVTSLRDREKRPPRNPQAALLSNAWLSCAGPGELAPEVGIVVVRSRIAAIDGHEWSGTLIFVPRGS